MNAFAPRYWMHETSGVLRPVIEAYLSGRVLNDAEVGIMRKYLYQWVTLGDWGQDVSELAAAVAGIRTREDVERCIVELDDWGMDPL